MQAVARSFTGRRTVLVLVSSIALVLVGLVGGQSKASADYPQLGNFAQDLCLGIHGSSSGNGAYTNIGTCGYAPGQAWDNNASFMGSDGYTAYQFKNGNGLCLTVQGKSTSIGAVAVQYTCSSGTSDHSQFWSVIPFAGNQFYLKNYHSGNCLMPDSPASGAYVRQQSCTFVNAQLWHR